MQHRSLAAEKCSAAGQVGNLPNEPDEIWDQAAQNWVLDVKQPAVKAIVDSDLRQLHCRSLSTLLCPQHQLTQQ